MQMVEIAKALSVDARIIIMDEPTSSLTIGESRHLFRIIDDLRRAGIGLVYISHRMEEVLRVADRITVLRDGRRVGDIASADATHDRIASMMVGREFSSWFPPRPDEVRGDVVLEVRDLVVPGAGRGVSFSARRGEIVGFAGLVGSGRTELMQALFGVTPAGGGDVVLEGRPFVPRRPSDAIARGVYLVPEDRKRHGLVLPMSVAQNVSLPSIRTFRPRGWLQRGQARRVAEAEVSRLRIRCSSVRQAVVNLSGGNQQKVVLGKWLAMKPTVLIVDEPTARRRRRRQGRNLPPPGRPGGRRGHHPPGQLGHGGGHRHERPGRRHARTPHHRDPPPRRPVRAGRRLPHDRRAGDDAARARRGGRAGLSRRVRRAHHAGHSRGHRTTQRPGRNAGQGLRHMRRELGMVGALVLVCLAVWSSNPDFLGPTNVTNTTQDICRLSIYAIGVSAVIITGGIDLSIGSIIGLTGVLIAKLSLPANDIDKGFGLPLWAAVAIALGVAVLIGFVQGSLITRLSLQPFIVTLGGMLVVRGVAQVLTGGGTLSLSDSGLPEAMEATLLQVGGWTVLTTPSLVLLVVVVVMGYLLHFTVFGRYLYAIGGSRDAAEYSGIPVKRVETMAYVLSATLAGVAGVVETYVGSMMHTNGVAYELYAIAAAVIGGVSLRGGEGTVVGVVIGAALLRVIYNGINLFKYVYKDAAGRVQEFRLGSQWEYVIVGTVIVLAVILDQAVHVLQQRRRTRRAGVVSLPPAAGRRPPSGRPAGPEVGLRPASARRTRDTRMKSNKVKIALVGAGGWGREHARVFSSRPDVDFVAVCGATRPRPPPARRSSASALTPTSRRCWWRRSRTWCRFLLGTRSTSSRRCG